MSDLIDRKVADLVARFTPEQLARQLCNCRVAGFLEYLETGEQDKDARIAELEGAIQNAVSAMKTLVPPAGMEEAIWVLEKVLEEQSDES